MYPDDDLHRYSKIYEISEIRNKLESLLSSFFNKINVHMSYITRNGFLSTNKDFREPISYSHSIP